MAKSQFGKHETPKPVAPATPDQSTERRTVKPERQCPLCYHGEDNGVGTAYSNVNGVRYYKCDKCPHTWSVRVKLEVLKIEHRIVDLETR